MCRELGVSEQTYYRWRTQYGGLKAVDAKRLKELEKQNATLKGDTTAGPDRALRDWLRAWAKKRPRYGYRRAYHDARAEG